MPEIEIRPAKSDDIPLLAALDHTYISDYVWQMEVDRVEEGQVNGCVEHSVHFRQVRLPRSVRVEYPRTPRHLTESWTQRDGLLVACLAGEPIGYISLMLNLTPLRTAWATDLAVKRRLRRQGIGSALVLAAQEWGAGQDCRYLMLEMQPKNYAAIHLAQKLGFDFCGYNDRYYANHDIGLFFAKALH
jgi:ribosomal protein S18 acetylase RimI-like enzyme